MPGWRLESAFESGTHRALRLELCILSACVKCVWQEQHSTQLINSHDLGEAAVDFDD